MARAEFSGLPEFSHRKFTRELFWFTPKWRVAAQILAKRVTASACKLYSAGSIQVSSLYATQSSDIRATGDVDVGASHGSISVDSSG